VMHLDNLLVNETSRDAAVITLRQRRVKGIAHQLWPAAVHMCKYLSIEVLVRLVLTRPDVLTHTTGTGRDKLTLPSHSSHSDSAGSVMGSLEDAPSTSELFGNYSVVELGAGVGMVGLYLAKLGFRSVILTDLEEAQALLRDNIALNGLDDRVRAMGRYYIACMVLYCLLYMCCYIHVNSYMLTLVINYWCMFVQCYDGESTKMQRKSLVNY
jgi:hypothetical protein